MASSFTLTTAFFWGALILASHWAQAALPSRSDTPSLKKKSIASAQKNIKPVIDQDERALYLEGLRDEWAKKNYPFSRNKKTFLAQSVVGDGANAQIHHRVVWLGGAWDVAEFRQSVCKSEEGSAARYGVTHLFLVEDSRGQLDRRVSVEPHQCPCQGQY